MRDWLARNPGAAGQPDVVVVGAPISRASISPSQAWSTPPAFREALGRFPTWHAGAAAEIGTLSVLDAGDVRGDRDDADASGAHARLEEAVLRAAASGATVVVIGGDNSLTRPAFTAMVAARPQREWGLLTLDAHHDCRPLTGGPANGTPVRELIEAGLTGGRVVQVGIHPMGNARDHARWAAEHGIHVHTVDEVRARGITAMLSTALDELHAAGADAVYADIDLDVVDRGFAPACPASLPGGLSPADLLEAALALGGRDEVEAIDLCEVDALADVAQMTVRLMAGAFTALCAGLTGRHGAEAAQ